MGNAQNIIGTINQDDIDLAVKETVFTADEVRVLWFHFKTITKFGDFIELQ